MGIRTVLAFDFGLRHIGVAVGQTVTGTASPVATLGARDGVPDWARVHALVATWRPDALLVGLPLNMDGSESEMSARARGFARRLAEKTGHPCSLVDERLTTREARSLDAGRVHEIAAVMIAESWLEAQRA
jgi:putative holliday junction resolvase